MVKQVHSVKQRTKVRERGHSGDKLSKVISVSKKQGQIRRPRSPNTCIAVSEAECLTATIATTINFNQPDTFYFASGIEYVQVIRKGVPAALLDFIIQKMHIPKDRLYTSLHLPRSTVDRKIRNKETLTPEQSERVLGLERLVGQVEVMVNQSGNPEGFDANRWVGEWLDSPLPALGGKKPADYMDTMEGQKLVSNLLAQSQSGAYA
ncbi:type II RES/Xre toxin-antitoxin system antitoxin [Candidatus Nitrotoga sp. 1052]|uniref:type II RES/Xre toxin-antitoxin system antitoxin n=1 Tax=Candidatus Nitrotoga sp. 1052 TaxID=2886964 RepID=UPI001EF6B3DF|nr:antitoxin Xre/MbcA/ParS toxin-binding domain-containing protein [Candidatus Nitrotoga sp. 1052]CAH1088909.1 hypothetical protein NTG1052_70054 [Candidatus Nitrotoga sp. 1052]